MRPAPHLHFWSGLDDCVCIIPCMHFMHHKQNLGQQSVDTTCTYLFLKPNLSIQMWFDLVKGDSWASQSTPSSLTRPVFYIKSPYAVGIDGGCSAVSWGAGAVCTSDKYVTKWVPKCLQYKQTNAEFCLEHGGWVTVTQASFMSHKSALCIPYLQIGIPSLLTSPTGFVTSSLGVFALMAKSGNDVLDCTDKALPTGKGRKLCCPTQHWYSVPVSTTLHLECCVPFWISQCNRNMDILGLPVEGHQDAEGIGACLQ